MVYMNRTSREEKGIVVVVAPFGALIVTYKHNSTQGKGARSARCRQDRKHSEENVRVSFQDKARSIGWNVTAPMGAWVVEQKTLENALVVVGIHGNIGLRRYNRHQHP